MLLAVVGVTWSVVCPHWWCSCRLLSPGGGGGAAGDTGDGVTRSRHTGPGHVTSAGHSDTPHWCGGPPCPPPAPPHSSLHHLAQHPPALDTPAHTRPHIVTPPPRQVSPSVAMWPAAAAALSRVPGPAPVSPLRPHQATAAHPHYSRVPSLEKLWTQT